MLEILIAVINSIIYGIVPFIDKLVLKRVSALTLNLIKYMFFAIITIILIGLSFIFNIYNIKEKFIKNLKHDNSVNSTENKKSVLFLSSISGFLLVLTGILYTYCLSLTNDYSYNTVIIVTLILPVVVTLLLNRIFLKEILNFKVIIGLILIILGLTIVTIYNKKEV